MLCDWAAFVCWGWAALHAGRGIPTLSISPGMPCAGGFVGLRLRSDADDHLFSLATSRARAICCIVILDSGPLASVRGADVSLESLILDAESGLCLDCD